MKQVKLWCVIPVFNCVMIIIVIIICVTISGIWNLWKARVFQETSVSPDHTGQQTDRQKDKQMRSDLYMSAFFHGVHNKNSLVQSGFSSMV